MSPRIGPQSVINSTWGSIRNAVIGCSAAVIFGLVVLLMSIVSATDPQKVFPSEVMATVAAPHGGVEYYLPYPGILPDNPLYKAKMVRDWVRLRLTFDQVEKAGRELLYADKRINAAIVLVEGGKANLGVATATKAEKYLARAVGRTLSLAKQGKDVKSLLLTLAKATAKHVEILEDLAARSTDQNQQVLTATVTSTRALQQEISSALAQ